MVNNTSRNRKLLAGLVGVNLSLALAISAGAVPMPGDDGPVRAASVTQIEEVAAAARQPGDTAVEAVPPPVPAPAAVAAPAVATTAVTGAPTTVPKPRVTAPPTTKAPVAKAAPVVAAPAVAPVAAPAAPVKVARRTPTAAEKQALIAELKRQVGGLLLLVSPTTAQIDQAGDQVCTAFDSGQSFAQVKATALSMIPASVAVTPATATWAVRHAVTLYCPGHAAKRV